MFKFETYYDKEKLPTIYTPRHIYKSPPQKRNINDQIRFDQTISNSINYLNNNNFDKINILLKELHIQSKLNPSNSKIMTIYNNGRAQKKFNNNFYNQRTKYKSYNNQNHLKNNSTNDTNIPFNDSYKNFINNLKAKKINLKENKIKDASKEFDNIKLKPLMLKKNYNFGKKILLNNIKVLNKKGEDSLGDKLKIFFTPSSTSSRSSLNKLNNSSIDNLNKKKCPLCHKMIDIYRFNTHYNLHPSKIFNWLYLGSYQNACNIKDLKDLKIYYVLNCAAECQNKDYPDVEYYQAKINDLPNFNISVFFKKTNQFIHQAKTSGKSILIHCQLGISRSTTCLIAYMIKYLGYTTINALQFIKTKRPHVMPNFGFLQQLKNYEDKIKYNKNEINEESNNNNNDKNNLENKDKTFIQFLKNKPV